MSEILARIRVRETHGIRRFLYPLMAYVALPTDTHWQNLTLSANGQAVPLQVTHSSRFRLDFAVSLDPYAECNLVLTGGVSEAALDDPLELHWENGSIYNQQQSFRIDLALNGGFSQVVYDGVTHFRQPLSITYNGSAPDLDETGGYDETRSYGTTPDFSKITARIGILGDYNYAPYITLTEITACKSWAKVSHRLKQPQPNDEIAFILPLAITSSTLTCDFGVGGYVFGKLDDKSSEIVWQTEFADAPYAKWTVATAGRVDYIGEVETAEAFLPQRWFHLIDSDKALAVAVTQLPKDCREMTVRMTHEGDVSVAFKLSSIVTGTQEFGVCYHFLNDVPAIAAATNPQSILLPPVVEVLPVT